MVACSVSVGTISRSAALNSEINIVICTMAHAVTFLFTAYSILEPPRYPWISSLNKFASHIHRQESRSSLYPFSMLNSSKVG